jgi:hypothetical protein
MTKLTYQKAMCGLAAVLVSFTVNGLAQEAGPTLTCSGGGNCPEPPIAIAAMGGPAIGQQVGVVSTGGMAFAIQENADIVKNQPYQAQAVTEMKQTLADGSHITQTTTATVARDSDGRTVRIQKLSTIGPWKSASDSSRADGPTLTSIFDPVANTHTDYTSDNKVAHVLPIPEIQLGSASGSNALFSIAAGAPVQVPPNATMGPVTFSVQGKVGAPQVADPPNGKTESLGTKTIESVSVTGTRTTDIIPAGAIGNDKDIVITRETWYSPDLKLVLQSTQTDPRFGETTYLLTNIQRSEPDRALFQVPTGYKIEKVPVTVQTR